MKHNKSSPPYNMQQLIQSVSQYLMSVVTPLIKYPESAQLRVGHAESGEMVRFRLVLEQSDVARVIGRNGMTASAIRSMAKAAGEKAGIRVVIHILSNEELQQETEQ
jgi:predicted RNA-binding protein YlqC (UPF0109 family)